MRKILTAEQMKACDSRTVQALGVPSRELMERAARACVEALGDFDTSRTVVLCGTGNNGGDGAAIADLLSKRGDDVTAVLVGNEARCTAECAFRLARLRDLGIDVIPAADFDVACLGGATAIVDAIFGVGLSRPVEGDAAALIEAANESGVPILAADVPSGLFADGAAIPGAAIRAKRTVAIQDMKPCHVLYPAALCCGEISVADIGVTDDVVPDAEAILVTTDDDLAAVAARPEHSHKGSFGRVLVVAGCEGMAGAAYLSALAAYRTGAGLAEVFTVEANRTVIQTLLPEAVVTVYGADDLDEKLAAALSRASAVVLGPGLGKSELSRRVVRLTLGAASATAAPLIIDADALNVIAEEKLVVPRRESVAVTPHLGEMARLTGRSVADLSAEPVGAARDFAAAHGVVCVLKDAHTVIAGADRTYINLAGCSALAKGGSGDVLTGVIAALAASGVDMTEACRLGCHLHGRAGERAAADHGLHGVLARDVANAIRR